jgi:hypothetical protein
MKFYVDSVCVLELSPVQEQILLSGIPADVFVPTMQQRVVWVINQVIDGSFDSLFNKWLPILQGRYDSLPSNPDKFAELIFSQPDYKPAVGVPVNE